jgi:hypothetical protein
MGVAIHVNGPRLHILGVITVGIHVGMLVWCSDGERGIGKPVFEAFLRQGFANKITCGMCNVQ